MKFGIIGIGTIAQKAYLPVLSERDDLDLVFCTRNGNVLNHLAKKYRVSKTAQSVEDLLKLGIDAAIVSTASEAHFEIAKKLLQNGVHTYIDKPVSFSLAETEELTDLSKEVGKIAMVGFNRRFIPKVRELKENGRAHLILMQKNRFDLPDYTRRFVIEDFIHVVDTLRFLMPTEIKDLQVNYIKNGDILETLALHLIGENCLAIGIMDRNGGVTEETIEYTANQHKYVVNSLVETTHFHNTETSITKFGDWEPTLSKRGFYQIIDHFIECTQTNKEPNPSIEDSLITHKFCEDIVNLIEKKA